MLAELRLISSAASFCPHLCFKRPNTIVMLKMDETLNWICFKAGESVNLIFNHAKTKNPPSFKNEWMLGNKYHTHSPTDVPEETWNLLPPENTIENLRVSSTAHGLCKIPVKCSCMDSAIKKPVPGNLKLKSPQINNSIDSKHNR